MFHAHKNEQGFDNMQLCAITTLMENISKFRCTGDENIEKFSVYISALLRGLPAETTTFSIKRAGE